MAGDRRQSAQPSGQGGIAAELAATGFVDAVEVGHGGAGVVYRCYEESLGRSVAIKVLSANLDDDNNERFLREGYAMGVLSGHPNIVNILHVAVTANNRPFIVMHYHGSGSLAERLRRDGRIGWPDALRIGVKLCGALETAHRAGTLHRDIKPANVLVNDYGEPQLSDFGIARIAGGYKTATGVFSGTISYTAPEVLGGKPPTVLADVYSLGATIYALIAGNAPHESKGGGEDLIAQYLRISTSQVPDLRPQGIPADVCETLEKAMSIDPEERYATAEEFGRALQLAQRHNGLNSDSMALSETKSEPEPTQGTASMPFTESSGPSGRSRSSGPSGPIDRTSITAPPSRDESSRIMAPPTAKINPAAINPSASNPPMPHFTSHHPPSIQPSVVGHEPSVEQPMPGHEPTKRDRRPILFAAAAAVIAILLVVSGIVFWQSRSPDTTTGTGNPKPTTAETQPDWRPITNARVARGAVATTQTDGTVWIFGGVAGDGRVTGRHEGYDPAIDIWKAGDDLPVPVQHAMAVTWEGTPVVLGGWRTDGSNTKVATDKVWRVVNSRWAELPPLLQPRAAAAAGVVGDKIIVTGGVDADGKLVNTTEIFDGTGWTLGASIPTPRQMVGGASDGNVLFVAGGTNGTTDLTAVESYDPVANSWSTLPELPDTRSDFGAAIADGRLVAVGGESAGEVLKSVVALDMATSTWSTLPDMATARHGLAVAAVGRSVYAIGGSTAVGDTQVTSTAEALKLAARKAQPASAWRTLPDAPTDRLMTAWAVVDDKIFIAGGMRQGTILRTVESYDPQTGVWQSHPPLPIPLHHATGTAYRDEFVVIGGASDELADASNKVFVLRGNSWAELPDLAHPRAAAAAAVVDDKLVVVGGQNAKKLVAETEVFDGNSWQAGADIPTPREHLAAVSDGTYVYAVGGRFLSSDRNSAAFERFDPASGQWTKLVDMPNPRGSYGATFIDGRIVAVGGEEPTRVIATVDMYDIAEEKWTALAPMSTPRHGQVVATVGSAVYCIGGANRPTHEGAVASVEVLDFS